MSDRVLKLAEPFDEADLDWLVLKGIDTKDGPRVLVVPYVQAHAIQARLDAAVGAEAWRTEFTPVREKDWLCRLSIRDDENWVGKEDGAEETDVESTKGGISGAFKRAAAAWGIGRYLRQVAPGWLLADKREYQGKPHYTISRDAAPGIRDGRVVDTTHSRPGPDGPRRRRPAAGGGSPPAAGAAPRPSGSPAEPGPSPGVSHVRASLLASLKGGKISDSTEQAAKVTQLLRNECGVDTVDELDGAQRKDVVEWCEHATIDWAACVVKGPF